jgi:predicted O-methyltransferase YrrM
MGILSFLKTIADLGKVLIFLRLCQRIDQASSNTAYSDLQSLYLAARDGWGQGAIVEVGAFTGKSAIALASASKRATREKLISIDPFTEGTAEVFRRNITSRKLSDYVITKVATSEEAARDFDQLIRLIFIDGLHDYGHVKQDIDLWKDRVIEGGILAFHDYDYTTVRQAVDELISSGGYFFEIRSGCTGFVSKGTRKNQELFAVIKTFNDLKYLFFPWKRPK